MRFYCLCLQPKRSHLAQGVCMCGFRLKRFFICNYIFRITGNAIAFMQTEIKIQDIPIFAVAIHLAVFFYCGEVRAFVFPDGTSWVYSLHIFLYATPFITLSPTTFMVYVHSPFGSQSTSDNATLRKQCHSFPSVSIGRYSCANVDNVIRHNNMFNSSLFFIGLKF